ncbi:MAG: thioredoxin family protein [Akkermansiaceae bacterium]|nr:thioredoxin family protein [Akkermansiaceae bacterium]NNM29482.1 thioredoxin family protein [Akkermansiaceae bacterium]
MSEVKSTFRLKTGDEAPAFSLPDPTGKVHRLGDVAGEKGTLVVFACNHCPFVVHLAQHLGSFAAEAAARGIATAAISSNDVENYPADAPDKMTEFAASHGWNFPYLYDESQEVAKAYGAACTPDFFLFDRDRKLFYAGQFDASRPKSDTAITGADLQAAVDALLAGEAPPADPFPSSGCNIKWKPGNEPPYFG